jgi:hypothetical protein
MKPTPDQLARINEERVRLFNDMHEAEFRAASQAEFMKAAEARRFGFDSAAIVHESRARYLQSRSEAASYIAAADGYIAAMRRDEQGATFAAREFMRHVRANGYKVLAAKIENEIVLAYNRWYIQQQKAKP